MPVADASTQPDALTRAGAGFQVSAVPPIGVPTMVGARTQDGAQQQIDAAPARNRIEPTDVLRDIGALAVLIWVLMVPWTPVGTGGHLIYVLLPVICSMASLALPYLGRLLVDAHGAPVLSRTLGPRLALNVPLAVSILVAVVWNAVDTVGDGDGVRVLGPGLLAGCFGLTLSAVPRLSELRAEPDGVGRAQRWRRFVGWAAGLGVVAIVISTLVTIVQMTQYGGLGGLFALLLLILALEVGFFVALMVVPALRVGADHPAWQPTVLWLAAAFVFVLLTGAGSSSAAESFGQAFYGIWLLMLAGGGCAVPFVGGSDPDVDTSNFWALVVANAFRTIVVAGCFLVAVCLLGLILSAQQTSVPGELIWALLAMVTVTLAAAVGSSRLRAGFVQGRNPALGSVAVMVLVTLITMVVSGVGVGQGGGLGGLAGLGVMFGLFGIIVVGLTVPRPVREAMAAAQRPAQPANRTSGPPMDPGIVATYPSQVPSGPDPLVGSVLASAGLDPIPPGVVQGSAAGKHVQPPPTGPLDWPVEATQRIGLAANAPASAAPVESSPVLAAIDDDLERTVMRPARNRPVAPATGAQPIPSTTGPVQPTPAVDSQASAAADPNTTLQNLMLLAHTRPDLRPLIAENPSTYPDLLTWLGQLKDPVVDVALARRREAKR